MHQNSNPANFELPKMALKEIPTPNADAKSIVSLVKASGRITGYKLSDGRILNKAEAVTLAKQGEITGVGIAARNGNEYLKTIPDGSGNNNLGNLPSVTE